jgi:hypothetical protein
VQLDVGSGSNCKASRVMLQVFYILEQSYALTSSLRRLCIQQSFRRVILVVGMNDVSGVFIGLRTPLHRLRPTSFAQRLRRRFVGLGTSNPSIMARDRSPVRGTCVPEKC